MRKAEQALPNAERLGVFHGIETAIPFLLAYNAISIQDELPVTRASTTEAYVYLGAQTTRSLLAALFRCCADIYSIRDHLKVLLDCSQYLECHHVILLLYAACRESVPADMITITGREEMLASFFRGVMQAVDDWLQMQDELWRREICHAE